MIEINGGHHTGVNCLESVSGRTAIDQTPNVLTNLILEKSVRYIHSVVILNASYSKSAPISRKTLRRGIRVFQNHKVLFHLLLLPRLSLGTMRKSFIHSLSVGNLKREPIFKVGKKQPGENL